MKHALLPEGIAEGIRTCGASWGSLDLRFDEVEDLIVVAGYSKADRLKLPAAVDWLRQHYSAHAPVSESSGIWYRADAELHAMWLEAYRRSGGLGTDYFREHVKGWRFPPADGAFFAITVATNDRGERHFAGGPFPATEHCRSRLMSSPKVTTCLARWVMPGLAAPLRGSSSR